MTMTDSRPLDQDGLPLDRRASELTARLGPLTYGRESPHSYFRDWLASNVDKFVSMRTPASEQRLLSHAHEMDRIRQNRERAARARLDAGGFEYRVEPNTTQGTGGYFTPPAWLNNLFAPARHAARVLADLIPAKFALPTGVSSINLPILTTGTEVRPQVPNAGVPDKDITDAAASSVVAVFAGDADVSLQLLEQSPSGAHIDWALFSDMGLSLAANIEYQLLYGSGLANNQLLGITQVGGSLNTVTFTQATPTGALLYPYFGQAIAQVGNNRLLPPECWLMRSSRWGWVTTQESTAGLPFGLPSPFFMGNDDETPDPVSGLLGFPVFLDESIPATLGAGSNQDIILCMRPTDLILLEGDVKTAVYTEVLSGSLGARMQLHQSVAAITNRYTAGISVITGTGMVTQSGF